MYSSLEHTIKWVARISELPTQTHVPAKMPAAFCVVERTSGRLDYPHDNPEYTVSVWAKTEDKAEEHAMNLAAAIKLIPPVDDYHINGVLDAPNVFHYGRDETGYDIWAVSFSLHVNLSDK